jgi:uncharacterized membrane protein YebE (DUF533 family)
MVDFDRVISRMLASPAAAGAAGGLLAGALTSKAGRRFGKRALQVGAVAAIAGLAWSAFERHRRGRRAPLAGGPSLAFLPPAADPEPRDALGLALVRTMIAAARADGKLDPRESEKLLAEIRRLPLEADEKALLLDELDRPVGLDEIAASAHTPERAAELYTAALLAIDVDTEEEREWLARLAARLALPDDLVAEIHDRLAREIEAARPQARAAAG